MALRFALFGWMFRNAVSQKIASASSTISSIEDGLAFDESQKLASHYIVFPVNRPDCPTNSLLTGDNKAGYGIQAKALDGKALERVFPHYGNGKSYLGRDPDSEIDLGEGEIDNRCMAACLEKGTDIKVAGHTMPHFHYVDSSNGDDENTATFQKKSNFDNWFLTTCKRVEVCFINYAVRERPLEVFWVDGKTKNKQFDLQYSERKTRCFNSFLGHTFLAIDAETGFEQEVTIEHTTTLAFGTSPPSSSQRFDGIEHVEHTVKEALSTEWRKHKMVKRTFSSLGFAKGRLPDDVFANMAAFYYNNRKNVVNEEWEGKGVFVNWWETDVKFVAIPWNIKQKWQLRLMELVSEWAGVDVEETSMYGLRQYESGARLLSHVDRLPTHAVSLIVNIAQINLASPWPVEVFDHADRLHEVAMDEGDIVYYESAKNLHSRNRPLTCKPGECAFVNLFTHYRPVNDGDRWHRNMDDMPNRPPPLLQGEVTYDENTDSCQSKIGSSSSNSNSNSDNSNSSIDNFLGVGNVECVDRSLGSFVSPTRFRATEANDLFRWWKATTDANLIGFNENGKAMYHDTKTNQKYLKKEDIIVETTQEKHDDNEYYYEYEGEYDDKEDEEGYGDEEGEL